MEPIDYDVIVVGAGNAAMCAAMSAQEQGAKVLVLERAPQEQRGGNSAFTEGGFLMLHDGVETIRKFVPDLTDAEIANTDFGAYTADQYLDELGSITQYHIDPDLAEILVRRSTDTVNWVREKSVRFAPKFARQTFKHEGRLKFFSGLVIAAVGAGRGLVDAHFKAAEKLGIAVRYNARATTLLRGRSGVAGVRVIAGGVEEDIRARAVVLACGGFEANREWRTRYLGPGWDIAKVRGTRYNTGDGIRMALDIGAQPYGHWSACHAVSWERYAPDFGDVNARTSAQRHSYPLGIMVNAEGKRFLDEGADFHSVTYARYGRIVLQQPGSYAWQVFDALGAQHRRDDYRLPGATRVQANTLEELVARMENVNPAQFLETMREYNAAVKREVPFVPSIKDGRCTAGLDINKSNWANPLETPPFDAYAVGPAITFTFGGLKIDTTGRVLDIADAPLPGLYAAGELVGGIWYFNYLGGAGLMSGAVFGRIAGCGAGSYAVREQAQAMTS
ncbi:MAG: FAD-binding dehydrogenase [Betaproteobacteria bacterium]|nr:FAD-binding dehydrogenase [Betaproteobacteria bacterium]